MRLPDLPVTAVLSELRAVLDEHPVVVLEAPPGSGKTTRAPLDLLDWSGLAGQSIVMTEPRRLAARSAATYVARLRGERVGETVGYRVRMESKVSRATRLEVVTDGLLVRRIQDDPELSGVGLLVFDEYHERSLTADLALALALDVQAALRPDLRLLLDVGHARCASRPLAGRSRRSERRPHVSRRHTASAARRRSARRTNAA